MKANRRSRSSSAVFSMSGRAPDFRSKDRRRLLGVTTGRLMTFSQGLNASG
jgi:hypothetical protein